jgi:hypothetical protein
MSDPIPPCPEGNDNDVSAAPLELSVPAPLKTKTKVTVVLFAGRVCAWQHCVDYIEKHIIVPFSEKGPVLVFASVHKDSDGIDADDVNAFLGRVKPVLHHTHHYTPADPNHEVFKCFRPATPNAPKRYASMLYHTFNAFKLMQFYLWKHPDLDPQYVIKLRGDFRPFTAWDLPAHPAENTIYYPRSVIHRGVNYFGHMPDEWLPDQVAAGSLQSMEKYCTIYPYIYMKLEDTRGLVLLIPEFVMYQFLVNQFGMAADGTCVCDYEIDGRRYEFCKED